MNHQVTVLLLYFGPCQGSGTYDSGARCDSFDSGSWLVDKSLITVLSTVHRAFT